MAKQLFQTRNLILSLVIILALTGVALVSRPILPLYDGIGFPDEAYRYLDPPDGAPSTLPPTDGSAAQSVVDGTNADLIQMVTAENGPQAQVLLLGGTMQFTDPNPEILRVTIAPVRPTVLPSDGKIAGNVYAYKATALRGQTSLKTAALTDNTHLISLRLPQGLAANAPIEYRPADAKLWQRLPTSKVGTDIYQAPIMGPGEYAIVELSKSASPAPAAKPKSATPLIATCILSVLAVLAVIIATVRHSRKVARRAAKNQDVPAVSKRPPKQ